MLDRGILDNNKSLINEINDVLNVGNKVTNFVGRKVVSPALDTADKGVKKLGNKYQDGINNMFR